MILRCCISIIFVDDTSTDQTAELHLERLRSGLSWPTPEPATGSRQETTDARILSAARKLISLAGLDFQMNAVAREAGVSRVTVFRRFESKRGLVEAVFRRETDAAFRAIAADSAKAATQLEAATEVLRRVFEATVTNPILRRLTIDVPDWTREWGQEDQEFNLALIVREGLRSFLDEARAEAGLPRAPKHTTLVADAFQHCITGYVFHPDTLDGLGSPKKLARLTASTFVAAALDESIRKGQ